MILFDQLLISNGATTNIAIFFLDKDIFAIKTEVGPSAPPITETALAFFFIASLSSLFIQQSIDFIP